MAKAKITQSEIDGVTYRRAKTWHIALSQLNNGSSMIFYILIGYISYLQTGAYGIAVAVAGVLLTVTRVFDGLIDPVLALLIDNTNTRFGKLRLFLLGGWVIRTAAALILYVWGSDGSHGILFFILIYLIYIVGNSMNDIAGNMMPPVLTNDPRQRPTVQIWATLYGYLFPMAFSIMTVMLILPKYGEYSIPMLRETCLTYIVVSFVVQLLACIGIGPADKPENFTGLSAKADGDDVKFRDMLAFLKNNKPFQLYVVSAASDKLAQQSISQAVVGTMLYGILIGNIGLGTTISTISMLPAILFVIIGARYTGLKGSKAATVTWSWICIGLTAASLLLCLVIDMRNILAVTFISILFFGLNLLGTGAKMVVTTANGSMRADLVDYELQRSGKYLPGVVTATYNFIDQLVTSLGSTIALGCVALIGYKSVLPQPTDEPTGAIKAVTLFLFFVLPILGWICTLFAMRKYDLTKERMVEIQKEIADTKAKLVAGGEE